MPANRLQHRQLQIERWKVQPFLVAPELYHPTRISSSLPDPAIWLTCFVTLVLVLPLRRDNIDSVRIYRDRDGDILLPWNVANLRKLGDQCPVDLLERVRGS